VARKSTHHNRRETFFDARREDHHTTIITAASGWYLGELIGDRQEIAEAKHLDICPIIAWEIQREEGTWHPYSGREARREPSARLRS
jgi:hypothetical protein